MKPLYGAIGVFNAICLIGLLLCLSVQIFAFSLPFYNSEYDKYKIHEAINMEKHELMKVTNHLLEYIKGNYEDLNVLTVVSGQQREFFNKREKDHMVDVKNLFSIGFLVRNILIITFVTTYIPMLLKKYKQYKKLYILAQKIVLIGFIAITAIFCIVVALNFDKAFIIFHEIFFNNDLWTLDPKTSLLINIVPIEFFMDISKYIAITFAASLIAFICCLFVKK